jgi:hypothetical protein
MEKRIHSKTISNLTYRHYLFHFKWPLLGFLFILSFLIFTQINLTSSNFPYTIQEQEIELFDINAIYPIDILNNNNQTNTNINYYFSKKDQLKIIDDADAVNKNLKIVLPLIKDQNLPKSYLILEFTKIFRQPKFCSSTNEQIFGKFCPYTNW